MRFVTTARRRWHWCLDLLTNVRLVISIVREGVATLLLPPVTNTNTEQQKKIQTHLFHSRGMFRVFMLSSRTCFIVYYIVLVAAAAVDWRVRTFIAVFPGHRWRRSSYSVQLRTYDTLAIANHWHEQIIIKKTFVSLISRAIRKRQTEKLTTQCTIFGWLFFFFLSLVSSSCCCLANVFERTYASPVAMPANWIRLAFC